MAEQFDLTTAAALLELQADGVLLTRGRAVAYMNPAAQQQLGGDFTGAAVSKVLPACLVNLQSHSCAAAVTAGERFLTVTVRTAGLYRLYTLRRLPEPKPVSAPGQELWTHLMNLRMLTQQLDSAADRGGSAEGKELSARFTRLYYQLHRKLTNASTLSGLDDGTLPFVPAEVECVSALQSIRSALARLTEGQGIALETELPEEPVCVLADGELLNRALLNLLLNALQQCKAGDALKLRLHASKDTVTIALADAGPGLSAERLRDLLCPEERGGLSVVQGVVRLHGGSFLAENNPGGGTTARILLPRVLNPSSLHSGGDRELELAKALLSGLADFLTPEQVQRLSAEAEFV